MILAIDIGNTNTVIGGIDETAKGSGTEWSRIGESVPGGSGTGVSIIDGYGTVGAQFRIAFSLRTRTNVLNIRQTLKDINNGSAPEIPCGGLNFDGAIISSTVPSVVPEILKVIFLFYGLHAIVVGPKLKMNINIPEHFHAELGPDIIVGLVAACSEFEVPVAVIDMGTASTIFAVDKEKTFIGGTIHPGIGIELKSLCTNTAMLPRINFEVPTYVIGKNTAECIQSGVFYGHAGMIETILERMEAEIGGTLNAVATGGLGRYIAPLLKRHVAYDEDLLFKGLYLLYRYNA